MKDRTPKCEKERLVAYLPVEMIVRVQARALSEGKTISKYIADLVDLDFGEGEDEEV